MNRIFFGIKNSPPVICVHSRIGFFIRRFRGCAQIVFEVVGGDADEAEEEVIERVVEVVFAVGAREDGAAFVEGACCDDVVAEEGAWTAGVGAIGEIGGEGGEVGHGC